MELLWIVLLIFNGYVVNANQPEYCKDECNKQCVVFNVPHVLCAPDVSKVTVTPYYEYATVPQYKNLLSNARSVSLYDLICQAGPCCNPKPCKEPPKPVCPPKTNVIDLLTPTTSDVENQEEQPEGEKEDLENNSGGSKVQGGTESNIESPLLKELLINPSAPKTPPPPIEPPTKPLPCEEPPTKPPPCEEPPTKPPPGEEPPTKPPPGEEPPTKPPPGEEPPTKPPPCEEPPTKPPPCEEPPTKPPPCEEPPTKPPPCEEPPTKPPPCEEPPETPKPPCKPCCIPQNAPASGFVYPDFGCGYYPPLYVNPRYLCELSSLYGPPSNAPLPYNQNYFNPTDQDNFGQKSSPSVPNVQPQFFYKNPGDKIMSKVPSTNEQPVYFDQDCMKKFCSVCSPPPPPKPEPICGKPYNTYPHHYQQPLKAQPPPYSNVNILLEEKEVEPPPQEESPSPGIEFIDFTGPEYAESEHKVPVSTGTDSTDTDSTVPKSPATDSTDTDSTDTDSTIPNPTSTPDQTGKTESPSQVFININRDGKQNIASEMQQISGGEGSYSGDKEDINAGNFKPDNSLPKQDDRWE